VKVLFSPWVLFMLVICGVFIAFGVICMFQPAGGLWIGIATTVLASVILLSYTAFNVWLVSHSVVRCLRWSVRVDEVELVKVSAGSGLASPNPGWLLVLQTAGGDRNGLACTSAWGAKRQAHRVAKVLGNVPVKDPFWWEPPQGSVPSPPRHADKPGAAKAVRRREG